MKRTKHYYKIGELVNDSLIIIEQTRHGNRNEKSYVVQSLKYPDAPTYTVRESGLKEGKGCAYSSSQARRIFEGNSLWSKTECRRNIIDVEHAKSVAPHTNKKIEFKCENVDCDFTKKMTPSHLLEYGFICSKCNINISYGQLAFGQYSKYFNLKFESEKILKGLPNRRVDFINWDNGMWVEIQGEQHTDKNSSWYKSSHTQDLEKRAFAKNNSEYNLIEIDMRISSWDYFKEQINKCDYLPNINKKDEQEILRLMEQNKKYPIKEIIELYTRKMKTSKYIGEKYGISYMTVLRILKKYNIDTSQKTKGLCDEDIIESYIELKMTVTEIGEKYNVSRTLIANILKRNGIEIKDNGKRVMCLNTGEIFNSVTDAKKWAIQGSKIGACCRNERNSAGRHPVTNEPLKWEYVLQN